MSRNAKANSNPLAERIAELGISAEELAQIVGRPIDLVNGWLADGPDAEAGILTRFLADPADAARRVERVRNTHTRTLKSEDWQSEDVAIPYGGGFAGTDAEAPA